MSTLGKAATRWGVKMKLQRQKKESMIRVRYKLTTDIRLLSRCREHFGRATISGGNQSRAARSDWSVIWVEDEPRHREVNE